MLLSLLSTSLPGEDRRVESGAIWHESFFISVNKTIVICTVGGGVDPPEKTRFSSSLYSD